MSERELSTGQVDQGPYRGHYRMQTRMPDGSTRHSVLLGNSGNGTPESGSAEELRRIVERYRLIGIEVHIENEADMARTTRRDGVGFKEKPPAEAGRYSVWAVESQATLAHLEWLKINRHTRSPRIEHPAQNVFKMQRHSRSQI